jgi:hypothetical protein
MNTDRPFTILFLDQLLSSVLRKTYKVIPRVGDSIGYVDRSPLPKVTDVILEPSVELVRKIGGQPGDINAIVIMK